MPIDLDWGDDEQRLAVMHFRGNWTGDDLVHCISRLTLMAREAPAAIELMVDMRNSLNPPNNLVTLVASILNRPLPGNIKQVVVISSTAFWSRIFAIIHSSYGHKIKSRVRILNSVDEAYAALDYFQGMV